MALRRDFKQTIVERVERDPEFARSLHEAIAEETDLVAQRADFEAVADQRYAEFLESGMSISWDDMRRYLEDRIAGRATTRPVARKLDR